MVRSLSIDLTKLVSIFGVIFIHVSFELRLSFVVNQTFEDIFRFGVPCFIILWAYFFEKAYERRNDVERNHYIQKRFFHSLTVFFIWSIFYFLKLADWESLNIKKIFTTHFLGYGWAGQYFLIVLFQLILLYPLIRLCYNIVPLRNILLFLSLVLYVVYGYYHGILPSILLKIRDNLFCFWIPYVFVGIALARNKMARFPMASICIILLIPFEFYFLKRAGLSHSNYVTPSVLLSSITFCITMVSNEIRQKSRALTNIITYIGSNTMTIYVSNPIVILCLNRAFKELNWFKSPNTLEIIMIPFFLSGLVLVICLAIVEVIKKCRLAGILN